MQRHLPVRHARIMSQHTWEQAMNENTIDTVTQRQNSLRRLYRERPDQARIADHARTASIGRDPFHGVVVTGDSQVSLEFGIHRAVGGDHDLQNPGDMLCAALAACLDSTLRMIAARMGLVLKTVIVEVRAAADVRGCLMVDRDVPAGFQRIDVDVVVEGEDGTDPAQIGKLTSAAERCCVVLQTLRSDIAVDTRFGGPAATAAAE
jgi:uncharacterized OsmC-like protein